MASLETEIAELKARNIRVETDKAWETSWTRKFSIVALTYFVAILVMVSLGTPRPYFAALMPTLGFFLSTLSLPVLKRLWIKRQK